MTDASREIPELPGPDADTFWNGEPTPARQVRVLVGDAPGFPAYWARPYVGQERDAVEVRYHDHVFYLDDEAHRPQGDELEFLITRGVKPVPAAAGEGWAKVTLGMGSPRWRHRELVAVSVRDRDQPTDREDD